MESDSIKVFSNLSDNVESFETKEDFMRYYERNKELIDKMPTRGLNTKYKIDGYKIGRSKNQLMLYPTTKQSTVESDDQKYIELIDHIQLVEKQNKQILSILKQLCDAYNAQQDVEFSMTNATKQSSTNYQDNQSQSSYTSGVYGTLGRSLQKTYR